MIFDTLTSVLMTMLFFWIVTSYILAGNDTVQQNDGRGNALYWRMTRYFVIHIDPIRYNLLYIM
jgi:hypothetical protein